MALNARQIAEIAEAAFRRGYQQGYTDGLDMVETVDLHDWRYSEPLDMAVSPLVNNAFPPMTALVRVAAAAKRRRLLTLRCDGRTR